MVQDEAIKEKMGYDFNREAKITTFID